MAVRVEPRVVATEVVKRTPTIIDSGGGSNIGCVIISAVGPRVAEIRGPKQFLAAYTIGGKIPRNVDVTWINAYYLSLSASLVVARSMNTSACSGLLFQKNGSPLKVLYKDNVLLTKQTNVTFSDIDDTWSFVLGDTVFFNGNYSDVQNDEIYRPYQNFIQVEDLSEVADSVSNWKECTAVYASNSILVKHGIFNEMTTETKVHTVEDDMERFALVATNVNKGDIVIVSDSDSKYKIVDINNLSSADGYEDYIEDQIYFDVFNKGIKVSISKPVDTILIPEEDWLFSVYSKAAQTSDVYKAGISLVANAKPNNKNFNFKIEYDGENGPVKKDYLVSLYAEANDPNGANSFIDNLNVMPNFNFEIEVFSQDIMPSAVPQTPFGASGLDLISCKKAFCMKEAISALEDQVLYDIEYLAPVGCTNLAFLKRYTQAGKNRDWFTPVDVPKDRTNVNSIQMYMREIDDSSNVYCVGTFDKNSGLTGWINYIACSTLYYERVMRNKSNGAEFAPAYHKNCGTVQMVNPVYQMQPRDRDKLLSLGSPVNFVKYDAREDLFYLNDNYTHQSVDDVLKEEHNRRLIK